MGVLRGIMKMEGRLYVVDVERNVETVKEINIIV